MLKLKGNGCTGWRFCFASSKRSHHNLGEWGSPVQPQTAEAVALHHIDALDAKLQTAEDALSATSDKELWTQLIRGLETKALYKMSF